MATLPQRVGILGGTFDPVHRGHVALALAAIQACRLRRVYFVPAPRPWHREDARATDRASLPDRYAMLALALADQPRCQPLYIPDRAGRPTYTMDQLDWMDADGVSSERYLILGADAFALLPSWKHYRRLLRRCHFIVAPRQGFDFPRAAAVVPRNLVRQQQGCVLALAGGHQLHWLGGFRSPASASAARGGAEGQLPRAVARYIRRAGLYQHAQDL
ncbi:MAG: nicotinate (nicotinamide) nucleotide adenylyltransferase [Terriglobales bacterium]